MTKYIPDGQIAAPECICRKMGRPGAPIVACEICGRTQPIAPPERTADGTGARRYQPMPGDVVELLRGGPPHVFGSRLVTVRCEARGHGSTEQWWVRAPGEIADRAPGEIADWCVETDHLSLVYRQPPVTP